MNFAERSKAIRDAMKAAANVDELLANADDGPQQRRECLVSLAVAVTNLARVVEVLNVKSGVAAGILPMRIK